MASNLAAWQHADSVLCHRTKPCMGFIALPQVSGPHLCSDENDGVSSEGQGVESAATTASNVALCSNGRSLRVSVSL